MGKILYLTAASSQWGLGHLKRSWEIIQLLNQKDHHLKSLALVPEQGDREYLKQFLLGFDEIIDSLNGITKYQTDVLVIDLPTGLQAEFDKLSGALGYPIVALDWYHQPGKHIFQKINLRGGAAGLKYAIIRREILKCASTVPKSLDLVVLLGARDRNGYLTKILKLLRDDKRYSNRKIAVILGPLENPDVQNFKDKDDHITFYRDPVNLGEIVASAKVGLSNGGTSLMELSALGTPTVIFPQGPEEENFALTFLDEGGSVMGSLEAETFFKQLEELWTDQNIWIKRSQMGRALIDGQGAERIVWAINEALHKNKMELEVHDK